MAAMIDVELDERVASPLLMEAGGIDPACRSPPRRRLLDGRPSASSDKAWQKRSNSRVGSRGGVSGAMLLPEELTVLPSQRSAGQTSWPIRLGRVAAKRVWHTPS